MNFAALIKAFDAVLAFGDAVKRLRAGERPQAALTPTAIDQAGSQIEARLTSVVVAALKEAFDRDHARLELERAQQQEQRRQAEEAQRLELRRQAVERELVRLRLLAGVAMLGWIMSVLLVAARGDDTTWIWKVEVAAAWLLLLGALGSALAAQRHVGASALDGAGAPATGWAAAALWLLVAGLALGSMSVLF